MLRPSIPAALVLALLCSCDSTDTVQPVPEDVPVAIKIGTFFGECVGYCSSETTINPANAVYVEWAYDAAKFPDRSRSVAVTREEWRDLTASIDMNALMTLDSVIGCPDCNDAGGEWVEVRSANRVKRVVFPRGAEIEPIDDFLARARAVRTRVKL